jgi:hypothetical protein
MSFWWRAWLFVAALLVTGLCGAQTPPRIVLVAPSVEDALLVEAARHLRGELGIHDFELVEVRTEAVTEPNALSELATREHAMATISFVRRGDGASADVWVSDRATGKTSIRTLSIEQGTDAARLLAIRTVDLLRASLSELNQMPEPTPEIVGRSPTPPPPAAARWVEPVRRAELRLEALALLPTGEPTPSFGGLLGVGYHARELDVRLSLGTVLLPARIENREVRARLRQDWLLAEALRRLLAGRRGYVALGVAGGAQRLQVEGSAELPWLGKSSSAWSAAVGPVLDTELALSPTWSLGLSARALLLLPKPVVDLGPEQRSLGSVTLGVSAGARARF